MPKWTPQSQMASALTVQHSSIACIYMQSSLIYTTIAALSPKSVFTNLSSKFDEILPVRSQFDTNHQVNFCTPTCCLSATSMRQSSRRCSHRRLLKTAHDFARLRTTKHIGRFYSFINKISFHGSRRFIIMGSCSASFCFCLRTGK